MSNYVAFQTRKERAIKEFEYILQTYILPLIQHDGQLILKYEATKSTNLKQHIKRYPKKKDVLYFFPALCTPQFHFRIKTSNPTQELGAAEAVLREIMCVSNFDYRTENFTTTNYYDKNNLYRNRTIGLIMSCFLNKTTTTNIDRQTQPIIPNAPIKPIAGSNK